MTDGQPIKVFVSYAWEDDRHKEWVRKFATRLRSDGIDVILDRWHAVPGAQLPKFMEKAVRESDYVLCICTQMYKARSDRRAGGAGYEGDIMTGEAFAKGTEEKFIPVLRKDDWENAAPSWLLGRYYIDLRGDPYSTNNYQDLLTTLRGERELPPPLGTSHPMLPSMETFEFVNREIELATLDPAKLQTSYWQCALLSAPSGYGKSYLLKRLITTIKKDSQFDKEWNCVYIDLRACDDPENSVPFILKSIKGERATSDADETTIREKICEYVLGKMSMPVGDGPLRNILIAVDSIDSLAPADVEWFSSVIHDLIVGSYVDYERRETSFSVRILLAGVDPESFWRSYVRWEELTGGYRIVAPKRLSLSAFDDLAVQDLINRRVRSAKIPLSTASLPDVSHELQYLSGGHPQVVCEILDELIDKKFLQYKDYLRRHRERLVRNHVSKVVKNILRCFPSAEDQKDIKTICVFRLIDLNTLTRLLLNNLVSKKVNINLLGVLCENKILNPPNAQKLFYHDDIIRRILFLDLSYGRHKDRDLVQQAHKCAWSLYYEWIEAHREQHSYPYFFVEWLFHSLQIADLRDELIFEEWKTLLSFVQSTSLPLGDLKRAIKEMIETDSEVRYLYRERFGSDDLSPLFAF